MRIVLLALAVVAGFVFAVECFLYALRRYEVAASGEGGGRRRGLLNVTGSFLTQVAATELLTIVCRLLGFVWPFRLAPDGDRTPVVFVHGYGGSPANFLWLAWLLRRRGFPALAAIGYPPFGGSVLDKARRLAEGVEGVLERTGASRVDLVAHSLGGIVARLYLRELGGARRVRRLVTLGTPHQGTRVAALSPDPLARSLSPGSRLLGDLAREDPVPVLVPVVSIFSTFDAKLLPARNGVYPGAMNIEVDGIGHDAMLFSPRIATLVAESLARPPVSPTNENPKTGSGQQASVS